jgi:hypothetical protein
MIMRFRQLLIALGACTLLLGAVDALLQAAPASAARATTNQGPFAISRTGKVPTITKVTPSSGTTFGNTVVTIAGTNLAGASSVTFGSGNPNQGTIVADSSSQITVIDPPRSAGHDNVIVTLPNGRSSAVTKSDRFAYVAGPAIFPSAITGSFTDNFTFGNDSGPLPPAETSTAGNFTLDFDPHACESESTDGDDAACYGIGSASVSGTGLQACYPEDGGAPTLIPFSFGTDEVTAEARIQVDGAGSYHLYFDFFAASAADGPVACDGDDQNSVIRLFHDPDGLDTSSPDIYTVGQGSASVNVQDNGENGDFGDGITAPGWSGSATFAFSYGPGPVAVSGDPAGGTVGTKYVDKSIAVSGGTAPYKVTATGLPPGLAMTSSGIISGMPTTAGTYTPTVTATDSSKPAKTGTETPTIVIAQGSPTVTLSASPASPQAAGVTLTLMAAIGGTAAGTADKGVVSFSSDGHPVICITTKKAKNEYTCITTAGALGVAGRHSLVASVAADANYEAAISAPLRYRVS